MLNSATWLLPTARNTWRANNRTNNVADVHANYAKWLQVLDTMAGWDVTLGRNTGT
jgi:hypothetical protein